MTMVFVVSGKMKVSELDANGFDWCALVGTGFRFSTNAAKSEAFEMECISAKICSLVDGGRETVEDILDNSVVVF